MVNIHYAKTKIIIQNLSNERPQVVEEGYKEGDHHHPNERVERYPRPLQALGISSHHLGTCKTFSRDQWLKGVITMWTDSNIQTTYLPTYLTHPVCRQEYAYGQH